MHERRRLLLAWSFVAVAIGASAWVVAVRGTGPQVGDVVRENITLVPQDRLKLACSLPEAAAGHSCAFAGSPPAPISVPESTLQPFMTVDRKMYLVAGLFQQPALLDKVRSSPGGTRGERFTLRCALRLIGKAPRPVHVRWSPREPWRTEGPTWVAVPEHCSL